MGWEKRCRSFVPFDLQTLNIKACHTSEVQTPCHKPAPHGPEPGQTSGSKITVDVAPVKELHLLVYHHYKHYTILWKLFTNARSRNSGCFHSQCLIKYVTSFVWVRSENHASSNLRDHRRKCSWDCAVVVLEIVGLQRNGLANRILCKMLWNTLNSSQHHLWGRIWQCVFSAEKWSVQQEQDMSATVIYQNQSKKELCQISSMCLAWSMCSTIRAEDSL